MNPSGQLAKCINIRVYYVVTATGTLAIYVVEYR